MDDQDVNEKKSQNLMEEKETLLIWTLEFDGSCSSSGSGMGVVLISLEEEPKLMVFKLEFGNTNKTTKYESLLLRIIVTKGKE